MGTMLNSSEPTTVPAPTAEPSTTPIRAANISGDDAP